MLSVAPAPPNFATELSASFGAVTASLASKELEIVPLVILLAGRLGISDSTSEAPVVTCPWASIVSLVNVPAVAELE